MPSAPTATPSDAVTTTAAFGFDGEPPGRGTRGEGRATIGCRGPSALVTFQQLTVDRQVELRDITARGRQVRAGRAWITDDPDQTDQSGIVAPKAPGEDHTDQPGWPGRRPLPGTTLEPGTIYTFFVRHTLGPRGRQPGFRVSYLLDGRAAHVDVPSALARRPCR